MVQQLVILLVFLIIAPSSNAKLFSNSYVSFELPPRWDCRSEGADWVCISENKKDARESIIIFTAKEVGPSDSLAQYEAYLKQPRSIPADNGKPTLSQIKGVKQRKINDHEWVDGLHLGSEKPSYYTRYLATTKQNLAILVTFSAHKDVYTKYSNDFFKAILSLRVTAPSKVGSGAAPSKPGTEIFGGPTGGGIPSDMMMDDGSEYPDEQSGSSSAKEKIFGFGLLLAAVGVYLFLKKRKKQ